MMKEETCLFTNHRGYPTVNIVIAEHSEANKCAVSSRIAYRTAGVFRGAKFSRRPLWLHLYSN